MIIWIFGKSASGKTTIGTALSEITGWPLFDGDQMRKVYNKDLGFSKEHRHINALRTALLAFREKNAIVALITPLEKTREMLRNLLDDNVVLVYLMCSDKTLRERDPKGLYKTNTEGIDLFEEPLMYDFAINTDEYSVEHCVENILETLNIG